MDIKWYSLSQEEVFQKLNTSINGLSKNEIDERIKIYGVNSIPEKKRPSVFRIFLDQFNSPLIFILLLASIITYIIGHTTDALIILFVLIFNAIVGTIQEGKAENTLVSLKKLVETKATVIRDGKEFIVTDKQILPGDIINLEEGQKVPADARVIFSESLNTDEASLTGESESVHKTSEPIFIQNISVADQKNMVFKGTHVVSGHGLAVVTAIGTLTVIGKIATEILSVDTEIPLKTNIKNLTRAIVFTVGVISILLFGIGILSGESVRTMFTIVVSLSVSIIPEGLPIVLTLVLATGVWRMSKQNALVKKLQAVEALGQASVIAVDKTGTITKNELVIRQVWTAGKMFDIAGIGYEPSGEISLQGVAVSVGNHPEILSLGKVVALCASARLSFSENEKRWYVIGDPTEAAMVVFAKKLNFSKDSLHNESPQIFEIPFDYKQKFRAVINSAGKTNSLTVVGAPEVILEFSKNIVTGNGVSKLGKEKRIELDKIIFDMSKQGQRVVAVGKLSTKESSIDPQSISGLTLVGLMAMKDVLRPEVKGAMALASSAGIHVVMITGDHKITAQAIAKEAGIYTDGDMILEGVEIDSLDDEDLAKKIVGVTVFARVTPEHKLKIIGAFKRNGEIIAMTGDGVNDAPSLVAADLGVAMGNIGTEVAKDASDIVLLDDNFGSIVSAIEEGRGMYKTIKKVILYLFSTSIGEVLVIIGALLLDLPLPILAAQIIWLNFVTDGFLDVSLAMEPKENGLLRGTFKKTNKYIVDQPMLLRMLVMAIPMMIGTLFLFSKYVEFDLQKGWTISLCTLAMFQWFNAWNCRSDTKSVFHMSIFSNKYLISATGIVIILQILAVYTPFLQKILQTVPLTLTEWLMIVPVALSIIVVEEIRKYFARRHSKLI